jgi:hypothetical protein
MTKSEKETLDIGCIETFESVRGRLRDIEGRIAVKLNLRSKNVRYQIIDLDRRGELGENELIADWHDLYASYCEWLRWGT